MVFRTSIHKLFLFVSLTLLCLSGCGFRGETNSLADLAKKEGSADYIIGPGDQLEIRVWREPELSGPVNVRDDGKLTMPLLNEISASGKTLTQLEKDITEGLQKFTQGATVTVILERSAPIVYYLVGNFSQPGEFRTDRKVTFLQAIATGHGFLPLADESSVVLVRKVNDRELRYVLDYNRVLEGKEPNFELKNGDVLSAQ